MVVASPSSSPLTHPNPNRRGFLLGLGAALAAPAVVRYNSLMPVRALELPTPLPPGEYVGIIAGVDGHDKELRMIMKLWRHASNYSMGPAKFKMIHRTEIEGLKDAT